MPTARVPIRRDCHYRDHAGSCRAPLRSQARAACRRYCLRRGKASEVALDRGITPHVPVWDKSARSDGKFSRADFVFDKERNVYICPAGATLTHSGVVDQGRILPYRASTNDCSICKLKPRCTTAPARKVSRDIDEDVREHVRALANTEAFQLSCRERKKVEVRFAHMKRILKLDHLRPRGLSGARDDVLLTATAQNLRRLAKFSCRGPPRTGECAA